MVKKLFICIAIMLFACTLNAQEKEVVHKVNEANSQVKSFTADARIVMRRRMLTFSGNAKIYYEKTRYFRLKNIDVVKGVKTSDIGSNNNHFWFWVTRLDRNTLFHSDYDNLSKTGLEDSLHPLWMMDSLGVNEIDVSDAKLSTQKGNVIVQKAEKNARDQTIFRIILIDPDKPAIVGHQIYSASGNLVVAVEVKSHYKTNVGVFIPKETVTYWYKNQINITTKYTNPQLNVEIDNSEWVMPPFNGRKIDIGKTKVDWNRYRR